MGPSCEQLLDEAVRSKPLGVVDMAAVADAISLVRGLTEWGLAVGKISLDPVQLALQLEREAVPIEEIESTTRDYLLDGDVEVFISRLKIQVSELRILVASRPSGGEDFNG